MYHFLHHFWGPLDGPSGAVGTEGVSRPGCGLGFPGPVCTGRCPASSGQTTGRPWPWSQGRSDWCPPPGSSPPLGSAGSSPSGGCHPVTKGTSQIYSKQCVSTNCRRMFNIIKHRDKCSNESTNCYWKIMSFTMTKSFHNIFPTCLCLPYIERNRFCFH